MKNISFLFLFSFLLFANSCSDPCDDVNCGANGICVEGDCNCDPGYSGLNCETNICDTVDCINGDCDPVTGACACDEGYEGDACDTEIRAKYLGDYSGDLSSCLADLIDPEQIPDEIGMAMISVVEDPDNINNIIIGVENDLLPTGSIKTDPTDGIFIIPTTSQSIEIPDIPFPITITVSGDGEFVDENNLRITFNIIIPLVQTITCTINLTKV